MARMCTACAKAKAPPPCAKTNAEKKAFLHEKNTRLWRLQNGLASRPEQAPQDLIFIRRVTRSPGRLHDPFFLLPSPHRGGRVMRQKQSATALPGPKACAYAWGIDVGPVGRRSDSDRKLRRVPRPLRGGAASDPPAPHPRRRGAGNAPETERGGRS